MNNQRSPRTVKSWPPYTHFIALAAIAYGVFVYYGASQVLAASMSIVRAQCQTGELICK